jgi:hypothetical protein
MLPNASWIATLAKTNAICSQMKIASEWHKSLGRFLLKYPDLEQRELIEEAQLCFHSSTLSVRPLSLANAGKSKTVGNDRDR